MSEIGPNWTTKRRGFLLINPWYNDPCLNRYYFGPKIISLYRVFTVGRSQVRGFKITVDHCGGEALGTGAKPRSNTHILDFEYLNHPLEVD